VRTVLKEATSMYRMFRERCAELLYAVLCAYVSNKRYINALPIAIRLHRNENFNVHSCMYAKISHHVYFVIIDK
jgi:hypothetical protein